ncbi:MAG: zinc-finger domain-containing protein [Burkholderiales bacterium]
MAPAQESDDATRQQIDIVAADLPLHCPLPSQTLWNAHPRVYLPMDKAGEALCPYCGTRYVLRGPVKAGH